MVNDWRDQVAATEQKKTESRVRPNGAQSMNEWKHMTSVSDDWVNVDG